MKRKLMLLLILCICFLVGCGGNDDEKDSGKNSETQQESEVVTEAEKVANMTEDEYKAYCEVMFNTEIFERDDIEGKHVKIYGGIFGIKQYTATSAFAGVIQDVIKEYDISNKFLEIGVAHEGKLSYGGDTAYLLLAEDDEMSIYEYEMGQDIIVYGEVVQCWSGPFIIPRYIEISEIAFPHVELERD